LGSQLHKKSAPKDGSKDVAIRLKPGKRCFDAQGCNVKQMLLVFRQGFQLILQKKRALCQLAISTLLKAGLQYRLVGCQNDIVQCRTMMPCKRLYLG